MSTRLHGRANNFIQTGNMQDARRILMKLLALEPDNAAIWQSYQATSPTIGEYQVVLRSLARRHPGNRQIANRIADLQNRKTAGQTAETAVRSRKFLLPLALSTVILVLCLLSAFFWLVLEPQRAALTKLQVEYQELVIEYESLQAKYDDLTNKYDILAANHQQLSEAYGQLQQDNNTLLGENSQLSYNNKLLQQDLDRTLSDLSNLTIQYNDLQNSYNQLNALYQETAAKLVVLQNEYNALASRAIEPPYIYIRGREVHLAFIRRNGALVRWHVPFDDLEKSIRQGYRARENPLNFLIRSLSLKNEAGEQFFVMDYRTFVDASPFRTVVPDLYYSSANDDAFIDEIWHIATQLTTYSEEIQDTPRYPLETLLAGGGDCEDTAILVASMIEAAPVNWDVNLVYMDLYNPGHRQTVNHLIVHVNTGADDYFIETTNPWEMQPNRYVNGWYYAVGDNQGSFSLEQ
jgi:hypothetical protein